jgi:hypothetical protein
MSNHFDFPERAIHIFERSFHSLFNPATANSRLSYLSRENRAFFLALFRHIHFITRKGCWRTSLELSKLLLALDPEDDPLGVILMIDFLALKAGEFKWFKRLWEDWAGVTDGLDAGSEGAGDIVGLPNLSYSIALAEYELEIADKKVSYSVSHCISLVCSTMNFNM